MVATAAMAKEVGVVVMGAQQEGKYAQAAKVAAPKAEAAATVMREEAVTVVGVMG